MSGLLVLSAIFLLPCSVPPKCRDIICDLEDMILNFMCTPTCERVNYSLYRIRNRTNIFKIVFLPKLLSFCDAVSICQP